jgi:hypothetical protein
MSTIFHVNNAKNSDTTKKTVKQKSFILLANDVVNSDMKNLTAIPKYVHSSFAISVTGKVNLKACIVVTTTFHPPTENDYEAVESLSVEDPEDFEHTSHLSPFKQVWNPWSVAGVMLRFSLFLSVYIRTIVYFYF